MKWKQGKGAEYNYAKRMKTVRELSAPFVEESDGPDDYSRLLLRNFRKIGELAGENRKMLEDILFPMLKEKEICEEEAKELERLNGLLVDAADCVGRSYNAGKTPEIFRSEVAEGAGTRYVPYMAEILEDSDTFSDICRLLNEGRRYCSQGRPPLSADLAQR